MGTWPVESAERMYGVRDDIGLCGTRRSCLVRVRQAEGVGRSGTRPTAFCSVSHDRIPQILKKFAVSFYESLNLHHLSFHALSKDLVGRVARGCVASRFEGAAPARRPHRPDARPVAPRAGTKARSRKPAVASPRQPTGAPGMLLPPCRRPRRVIVAVIQPSPARLSRRPQHQPCPMAR